MFKVGTVEFCNIPMGNHDSRPFSGFREKWFGFKTVEQMKIILSKCSTKMVNIGVQVKKY